MARKKATEEETLESQEEMELSAAAALESEEALSPTQDESAEAAFAEAGNDNSEALVSDANDSSADEFPEIDGVVFGDTALDGTADQGMDKRTEQGLDDAADDALAHEDADPIPAMEQGSEAVPNAVPEPALDSAEATESTTSTAISERQATASPATPQSPISERRAFFGQNFRELDRGLTPMEQQEWNSIYASYRGRSVMTGKIAGVDPVRLRMRDRDTGEMVWQRIWCATVIPYRVRILIPETEMWSKDEERPRFVFRNISDVNVDFVIIQVDRASEVAFASRRMALPSRRYFFSTQPELHRPGSRIRCDVLSVGPRRCLVCCNGYDLNLTQRELSYTAVPDLREKYHSGQSLECVVKEYDSRSNHLVISVKEAEPNPFDGAELRHPEGCRRSAVIAGKYAGGVFCNLPDNVTVMCNYAFHYDDAAFRVGDRVMLVIQRHNMERKQIYGKIVAKV